jgi:anti-anti-sigma regulatory factor
MSHLDPPPPHVPNGHRPPAPRHDQRPSNAWLLIDSIGSDHLDIHAVGSFNTDSLDRIACRLNRLVASASHLYINFHNVADIDDTVASLFRDTAMAVEAAGGTLNLVGLHASFYDGDTTTSEETVNTHTRVPNAQQGSP